MWRGISFNRHRVLELDTAECDLFVNFDDVYLGLASETKARNIQAIALYAKMYTFPDSENTYFVQRTLQKRARRARRKQK
jgi:hypothetical protein